MIPHGVEIFVGLQPIDLCWGFDMLAGVVEERIALKPWGGALFVFFGKRRDALKVLFHDGTEFCLFYKRLDKGAFQLPEALEENAASVVIEERALDDLAARGVQYPGVPWSPGSRGRTQPTCGIWCTHGPPRGTPSRHKDSTRPRTLPRRRGVLTAEYRFPDNPPPLFLGRRCPMDHQRRFAWPGSSRLQYHRNAERLPVRKFHHNQRHHFSDRMHLMDHQCSSGLTDRAALQDRNIWPRHAMGGQGSPDCRPQQ